MSSLPWTQGNCGLQAQVEIHLSADQPHRPPGDARSGRGA